MNAIEEARRIEDTAWPPGLLLSFAYFASHVSEQFGTADAYRNDVRRRLALAVLAGDDQAIASARHGLAHAASIAGDFEEAVALLRDVVAEQRTLVRRPNLHMALSNQCGALLMVGDIESAAAAAREAWPHALEHFSGFLLDHVALLASRIGRCAEAARMLGRADAWYAASQMSRSPTEARSAQLARATIETSLETDDCARLLAAGGQFTDAQIDALVRSILSQATVP